MNQPQPERQGDGLREKVLAVFDKVIVDPAGVINAPQLTDEICRIVRRWEKPVITEDDGTREPIPDGWQPPTDTPPSSIIGAEGAGDESPFMEDAKRWVTYTPPKPAPDAMVLEAAARIIHRGAFEKDTGSIHQRREAFAKAVAVFALSAAPVPSPDGAGEKRVKLSLVIEALESAANDARQKNISGFDALTGIAILLKRENPALSPATGAAEPVATIEEAMWMLQDVPGATLIERIARLTKWYMDLSAAPLVRGDKETVAVPAVAPEPCPCCGGKLHLNGANYSCDKNSSMSFHLDDLSLPVQPGAGEGFPLTAAQSTEISKRAT